MANETNRSAQRPTAQPDFNVSQKTSEMGVSENKYIIADERKKLFEINERLKKDNLPADERKKLEDERDETQKSIDIKSDKNLRKDDVKEDEDIKDIFKEDDILKYMYNEWLLGGANWLFKKTYKGADWLAQKGAGIGWEYGIVKPLNLGYRGIKYTGKKLFTKKPPRDDETTRRVAALDERHNQYNQNRAAQTEEILNKYNARLARIHKGTETEEDKKSPLFREYHGLGSLEERKKYIAKKAADAISMASNRLTAYRLAEKAAALKQAQNSMNDKNYQRPTEKEHQAEVRLMALLIARKIHSSNEPSKTIESFDKQLNNAQEQIQKNLSKGKYDANGKTSKDNKYLKNFLTELGLTGEGNLPQNTTKEHLETSIYQKGSKGELIENLVRTEDTDWLQKLIQTTGPETMQDSLQRSQSNMAILNDGLNTYEQGKGALLSYRSQRAKENAPSLSRIDAMYKKMGIATNPYHNIQGQGPLSPEYHKTSLDITKGYGGR